MGKHGRLEMDIKECAEALVTLTNGRVTLDEAVTGLKRTIAEYTAPHEASARLACASLGVVLKQIRA